MNLYEFDKQYIDKNTKYICGVDEAGRGPIAGPVVAAAVIMDLHNLNNYIEGINDSKKLTQKQRESLYYEIVNKCICFGIGIVDNNQIDEINILNATKKAMIIAINQLKVVPDLILTDFVKLNIVDINIPKSLLKSDDYIIPIVKGDSKSFNIASASIIAKFTRDRIMMDLDKLYPQYLLAKNKGYPTKEHIQAIKNFGICKFHRKSFKPVSTIIKQYEIFEKIL